MKYLEAMRRFLTSSYALHLEAEIAHLRGQNAMLILQLTEALKPKVVPQVQRAIPKISPVKTSWESYLAQQIALQEDEEKKA